jgi:peroxiredoxin
MKHLLLLIFLVIETFCYAQSYEEAVDKCTQTFQLGLDPNNIKELESKMEQNLVELRKCIIGLKFPSFTATTIDNTTYTLNDLRGKVVLINLWFIGCPPCVAEIPMFNELQNEFSRKDFVILSFGLDDNKSIEEFIKKHPINFSVFANSSNLITNKFKMTFGYPTNLFLDKDGQLIDFTNGGAMDDVGLKKTKEEFKSLIERELSR